MRGLCLVPCTIAGAAVAAVLALGVAGLGVAPAQAQSKVRIVAVEAITLEPTPLVETVFSIGDFVANEGVTIRPEVDGRIVEISFEEGQPVTRGQLLFRLDASIYQAQLREAEARLNLSRQNYDRAAKMNLKGHSSGEILDRALSEKRINEANVEVNKARLEKMRIVAPFTGTIGLRRVSLGEFVEAKNELVTLVSLDPLKVEFRLPERDCRIIRNGGDIRAEPDALPGEVFEGQIYAISPVIDINGRSIAVKAKVANPERRLRPGMFARVSLLVDQRIDALVVPESAIMQRGDGQFVYRILEDKAVLAKVSLGLRQTGRVEVVAGLSKGDTVITAGQIKLRPGYRVKVVDYAAPGPGKQ